MSDAVTHNERNEMTGGRGADDGETLHEPNTVNVPAVVAFLVALAAAIVVIVLLLRGLLIYFDARKAEKAPPRSPLATGARLPPEPRLQGAPGSVNSPAEDIRRFREQESQMLNSYGWIDRQNGVIRIPIERAKELIEQRGLPATPPSAAPQGAEEKR
ncbi:MAG TPA: hypothetical protein VFY40_21665 [Blastocatellia bacterium]|nr:hypothetical protein [Blastocatellia bacterium]